MLAEEEKKMPASTQIIYSSRSRRCGWEASTQTGAAVGLTPQEIMQRGEGCGYKRNSFQMHPHHNACGDRGKGWCGAKNEIRRVQRQMRTAFACAQPSYSTKDCWKWAQAPPAQREQRYYFKMLWKTGAHFYKRDNNSASAPFSKKEAAILINMPPHLAWQKA